MNEDSDALTEQITMEGRAAPERCLFGVTAWVMTLIVFAGFAPSYFLKAAFGTRELPVVLHLHGLLMTTWFVLLVVQSALVAKRKVLWHRRLGVFGGVLAGILVPFGLTVVIAEAKRQADQGDSVLELFAAFYGIHLVAFAVFVAASLALRRLPAVHKRLMIFGILNLLRPALGRLLACHKRAINFPFCSNGAAYSAALSFSAPGDKLTSTRRFFPT